MSKLRVKISPDKICNPNIYADAVKDLYPTVEYVSLQECQQWARGQCIFSKADYLISVIPENIPKHPDEFYKKNGWPGWESFLGMKNPFSKHWIPIEQAKKWVKDNNIKTIHQLIKAKRPYYIPSNPKIVYKRYGWNGEDDFFDRPAAIKKEDLYYSYEECSRWAIENNVKSETDYFMAKKPVYIPHNPKKVYSEKWPGWAKFLGKKK